MNRDLQEIRRFGFLNNFFSSPYKQVSDVEKRKMWIASFLLCASAFVFYFFQTELKDAWKDILFVFALYNIFHIVVFFYAAEKIRKNPYRQAYKDLIDYHEEEAPRFLIFEYQSAMRMIANLFISDKELNEKMYSNINVIEGVLNHFNKFGNLSAEELDIQSEIYIKDFLMDDLKKTLPIIESVYKNIATRK